MPTLVFVLTILIWPLCFLIIGLILLQGGAGDLSSAFGGGGQLDSTLGVGAGRKMSKLTGWLGVCFLLTVTVLAIPIGLHAGDRKIAGDANAEPTMSPVPGKELPEKPAANSLAPVDVHAIPGAGAPADAPVQAPAPTDTAPAPADAAPKAAAPAAPAPADAAPKADAPAAPAKLKLDD